MAKALKILLIEDNPDDAEAIINELRENGLKFIPKRIETRDELDNELDDNPPDVVLSDFTLPTFDAMRALRVMQKRRPDIPFILVTGTRSEEVAVDCIKEGADDYILKASLMRLRSSIDNILRKKAAERERERAEESLRALPSLILEAQETERRRVARDLHDSVNQILASAKFRIQAVEERLKERPDDNEQITQVKRLLEQAMQEVRRISNNLRPSELDDLGLLPAIRRLVEDFNETNRLNIRFTSNNVPDSLPKELELNLYRILQEALNNIRKHASATFVTLNLAGSPSSLQLTIQDDGSGFITRPSRTSSRRKPGMGLVDMKERARFLKGSIKIDSAPGNGTLIQIEVPIKPEKSTSTSSGENDPKKENQAAPRR